MTQHHWQCTWHPEQRNADCDCGLTGPRHWRMDHLPHDRAPTPEEAEAWRLAIHAREPGECHDELEQAHAAMEAGE